MGQQRAFGSDIFSLFPEKHILMIIYGHIVLMNEKISELEADAIEVRLTLHEISRMLKRIPAANDFNIPSIMDRIGLLYNSVLDFRLELEDVNRIRRIADLPSLISKLKELEK